MSHLSTDQTLQKAYKYSKNGNLEEASKLYSDILFKFPKNVRAKDGLINTHKFLASQHEYSLKSLLKQNQFQLAAQDAIKLSKKITHSCLIWEILGFSLFKLGQYKDSISAYKNILSIDPNSPEICLNVGLALKASGNYGEAINFFEQAINLKPTYPEAFNNIGIILMNNNDFDLAIDFFKKGILVKPNFSDLYNNLGNAFYLKKDFDKAINIYEQGISVNDNCAELYNNLGNSLRSNNNIEKAIYSFTKAIEINSSFDEAYYNLGHALKNTEFLTPNPNIQNMIIIILNYKTYVRPIEIAQASISLIKKELNINSICKKKSFEEVISILTKIPLLLELMGNCPIIDIELENILRKLRSDLLLSCDSVNFDKKTIYFLSKLGLQCFINEFVYNINEDENNALNKLEYLVELSISKGLQPNIQYILCIATYKALFKFDWIHSFKLDDSISNIYNMQVYEPLEEKSLKFKIPMLNDVTNKISSKVKSQYEKYPYPRWVNTNLALKPLPISNIMKQIGLRINDKSVYIRKDPKILVAGCGTGQQSISIASRFKNSNVTAIDISLSSLAYAKRKTQELNLKNIKYLQADILDLDKLEIEFDIAQCVGVLHHMEDPIAGLKKIVDRLKVGGLIKIGLYSKSSRKDIIKLRESFNKSCLNPNESEMKLLRFELINSSNDDYKHIIRSKDFYNLSSVKDLIFHVNEHVFTIPQISNYLKQLGLIFCGFEAEKIVQHFKLSNKKENDIYDLNKWHLYEKNNSFAFGEMYQFWCQKTL